MPLQLDAPRSLRRILTLEMSLTRSGGLSSDPQRQRRPHRQVGRDRVRVARRRDGSAWGRGLQVPGLELRVRPRRGREPVQARRDAGDRGATDRPRDLRELRRSVAQTRRRVRRQVQHDAEVRRLLDARAAGVEQHHRAQRRRRRVRHEAEGAGRRDRPDPWEPPARADAAGARPRRRAPPDGVPGDPRNRAAPDRRDDREDELAAHRGEAGGAGRRAGSQSTSARGRTVTKGAKSCEPQGRRTWRGGSARAGDAVPEPITERPIPAHTGSNDRSSAGTFRKFDSRRRHKWR